MLKNKKGLSLVELLVTLVIMGFFLPMMYSVLITVQRSNELSKIEIQLQSDTRKSMDYMINDIREASLIYERNSTTNISNLIVPESYKYPSINNVSTNSITRFTVSNSDENFTNYLNISPYSPSSPESSAIALIKYANRKCISDCSTNPKYVKLYNMVFYYLTLNKDYSGYTPSTGQLRSLIKAVSKKQYYEPTGLNSSEIASLNSQGYVSWTIPKSSPFTLPPKNNSSSTQVNYEDFNYFPMNLNLVPPDIKNVGGTQINQTDFKNGVNVPLWGGLRIMQSQNKSLIKITLISALKLPDQKGLKTAVLDTIVRANNLETN